MSTKRRTARLRNELKMMRALEAGSSLIDVTAQGNPVDLYEIVLRCRGFEDRDLESDVHHIQIYLPALFPRIPPQVYFMTDIYHPNIMAPAQAPGVEQDYNDAVSEIDSEDELRQIVMRLADRDFFTAFVCLDVLDGVNWSPALTLDRICIELAEMVQYKRYNLDDPLNPEAAAWAGQNEHRFPVDRREVFDPPQQEEDILVVDGEAVPRVVILGEETLDT